MEASARDLGPRSGGKQLDLAFNIYFGNFTRLLLCTLVVIAPFTLVQIILDLVALQEVQGSLDYVQIGDTRRFIDVDTYIVITIVEGVLGYLVYLLAIGVAYRAASEAYMGRPVNAVESIRFAAPKTHSILWITFLTFLATMLGLVLLIIGAIWISIGLAVAVPALMVEDLRGSKALRRSWNLIRDNWWRTFGVLIVAALFAGLLSFIAGLAGAAADGLAENNIAVWVVIVDSLSGIATAFTAALLAVVATVIYYDLRIRKEGFDVEMLADRLDAGDGGGAAARQGSDPYGELPGSKPPPPPGGLPGGDGPSGG